MTFSALTAGLVAAGITLPLLVAMYFLKLRRRQLVISSTLLWKRAIQDLQVNSPFQKLRKNLLLLLQLLLLLALLVALAGPMRKTAVEPGRRTVILIDHSASMNATDETPSRLARAKEMALRLVENIAGASDQAQSVSGDASGDVSGGGGVMVISFAHQARVVQPFTTDRSLLRAAVRGIEPTDQPSNLEAALRLVEPFAARGDPSGGGGGDLTVHVISDGRVQRTGELSLRGGKLLFERVGRVGALDAPVNLAIVSLSARRDLLRAQKVHVFALLANFGPAAEKTNLTLLVDGQAMRVVSLEVPAVRDDEPGTQSAQFELELTGSALLTVAHDHDDHLAADNSASLVVAPPEEVSVLLVTGGNAFLERVIDAVKVRRLVVMSPSQYEGLDFEQLARSDFDVVVFDGYSPRRTPPMASISFGAAPPIPGLGLLARRASDPEAMALLDWKRDDPLLSYVTLDDLVVSEAARLAAPSDAVILATAQTGPVMAVVEDTTPARHRHVITSFELLKTNWPMQISFAVFMSNALQTLGPGAAGGSGLAYRPGDIAVVPVASASAPLEYSGPVKLSASPAAGVAVLPVFEKVGVYRAASGSAVAPPWDRLAVNLTDPTESDLRPVDQLQVGAVPVQAQSRSLTATREVWHWFAGAALVVLLIEWLVYTRRMHL